MQPPDFIPSTSIAIHDAVASSLPMSSYSNLTMTTTTNLLFSIATAAASAASAAPTFVSSELSSTPSATPSPGGSDDENTGECKLLGPFAIFVQGALGALALLSLVYKRWRERPQRPLKIWTFDASKQVIGSVLLHLANLLMSMLSSGQIQDKIAKATASTLGAVAEDTYQPNPCSFYLLNLAIDTTIGIPILILILKVLTVGASYTPLANPPESIESGHYGTPPRVGWWLKQCLIYFVGLIGMKLCVFIIFQLCPWLGRVGDWALRWTEGNEAVQIAFVMFIFPLIMNAAQYYIIDTFIKNNKGSRGDSESDAGRGESEEHGALLGEEASGHGQSIDEDEVCKADDSTTTPKQSAQLERIISYDADKDGDEPTHARPGGSSTLTAHAEEEGLENRPQV